MKPSLSVRVLGIVTAVNLVVFAGAFWLTTREIESRLRTEYERNLSEASLVLLERLQSTVDQEGGLRVATILAWPMWRYFGDALIVHRNLSADDRGRIHPRGAWLNPLGRSNRSVNTDEQAVLADLALAIQGGDSRPSQGGTAIPIRDATGAIWGGCWFTRAPFRPASPIGVLLPGFLLSTLLITLATAWILRRSVLDPVSRLSGASARLAAGDLAARAGPGSAPGEIGDLIRTFDVMAGQIQGFDARRAREVHEATEQVRRAEAAAMTQRRLAATGELAAGIAHEINNPLGGLLNAVDALERSELPPAKRAQYHGLLRSGLERIRRTVGQLLRFTPRSARPVPLALVEPVADAIALVQHRASALEVMIRLGDPTDRSGEEALTALRELPLVLGEAHELGQAVLNLLVNALDAIEESGRDPRGGRIDVRLAQVGEAIQLVVEDDGPGVALEDLPRIADLFFTTKEIGKGTGLGLGIVHRVVHQHAGSVHITSEPGRGLRVEISLPVWRPGRERSGDSP
jgi:signal transduction histidine kinase